jgi:hypothetical protein
MASNVQALANNARQWVSRRRKTDRIFTVTCEGETLVPAFLLDDEFEPRPAAHEPNSPASRGWRGWVGTLGMVRHSVCLGGWAGPS